VTVTTQVEPHTPAAEWQFSNGRKIDRQTGESVGPLKVMTPLSSNNMTRYTTIMWEDGVVTCDCPGWTIKKKPTSKNPEGHRTCKHCKSAVNTGGDNMTLVNDFVAPTQGPAMSGTQFTPHQRQHRRIKLRQRPDA